MSHFVVLVIGDDVAKQLQPYHEFECTGVDDEYVVDVDVTDKVMQQFNEPQKVVRLRDGTVITRWDERFLTAVHSGVAKAHQALSDLHGEAVALSNRIDAEESLEATVGLMQTLRELVDEKIPEAEKNVRMVKVFNKNTFELPDGAVEDELSADQARVHGIGYATIEECAAEYYGAKERDGRFYNRTNPQSRWDWWVIGGRWTGWYAVKPGRTGSLGKKSWGMDEPIPENGADVFRKGDIDFLAMRDKAGERAGATWDKCRAIVGNESWESWTSVIDRHHKDVADDQRGSASELARKFYHGQPAIRLLTESGDSDFRFDLDDNLVEPRDKYVQRARDQECSPYAIVMNGQWIAKGDMGWWGISTNEKEQADWNWKVNRLFDELPEDVQVTVVDCHI